MSVVHFLARTGKGGINISNDTINVIVALVVALVSIFIKLIK